MVREVHPSQMSSTVSADWSDLPPPCHFIIKELAMLVLCFLLCMSYLGSRVCSIWQKTYFLATLYRPNSLQINPAMNCVKLAVLEDENGHCTHRLRLTYNVSISHFFNREIEVVELQVALFVRGFACVLSPDSSRVSCSLY